MLGVPIEGDFQELPHVLQAFHSAFGKTIHILVGHVVILLGMCLGCPCVAKGQDYDSCLVMTRCVYRPGFPATRHTS